MKKKKEVNDSNEFGSEIYNVCDECGLEANRRTCLLRFGSEPTVPKFSASTYHRGKCDWCGKVKGITEVRDYFNPIFGLP